LKSLEFKSFASIELRNKFLRDELINSYNSTSKFNLALSGGNTPVSFFDFMNTSPLNVGTQWNVFWVDERMVPNTDERYNASYPMSSWLVNEPNVSCFPINTSLSSVQESTLDYQKILDRECKRQIDFILLGMGGDGHTASIFPNNGNITSDVFWCKHPSDGTERVSMNYNLIASAKKVVLLIQGEAKKKVLEDSSKKLPIHILLEKTQITCFYID
jgi:6-phosphogluconolactonase